MIRAPRPEQAVEWLVKMRSAKGLTLPPRSKCVNAVDKGLGKRIDGKATKKGLTGGLEFDGAWTRFMVNSPRPGKYNYAQIPYVVKRINWRSRAGMTLSIYKEMRAGKLLFAKRGRRMKMSRC